MSNARYSITQARAVKDHRITHAQFRTLAALGMYSDENGWCWPSQSTLGEDVAKGRQTINEDIAALVKLGYLEKSPRGNSLGGRSSNMYRLVFDPPSVGTGTPLPSEPADMNVPIERPNTNNTANEEKTSSLPMDWKIAGGQEITEEDLRQERQRKMMDSANLIAMQGFGVDYHIAYGIAYTFMHTRDILIPESKIKGQRKAVKDMMEMGVLPNHVQEAVNYMLNHKPKPLTCVDLYSVSKTAIDIANPPETKYEGALEGV